MAKCEMAFKTNAEKTAVIMRLVEDGKPFVSWTMEAPELDQHIRSLANQRADLVDEVAPDLEPGALVADAVLDPAIRISSRPPNDLFLLAYRHPGLGWLSFALTKPRAEALARQLEGWLSAQ